MFSNSFTEITSEDGIISRIFFIKLSSPISLISFLHSSLSNSFNDFKSNWEVPDSLFNNFLIHLEQDSIDVIEGVLNPR